MFDQMVFWFREATVDVVIELGLAVVGMLVFAIVGVLATYIFFTVVSLIQGDGMISLREFLNVFLRRW